MTKLYSLEYCKEVAEKYGGTCLSSEYKNNSTKMIWVCENRHEFCRALAKILIGRWCSRCRKTRLSLDIAKNIAMERGGKCLSEEYINNKSKLLWECKHNHTWEQNINKIKLGHWCPHCSGRSPLGIQFAHEIAHKNGGMCLSKEYKDALTPLDWRCGVGHVWSVRLSNIQE